jgi:YidC/Oxa1 family membrane protein insertase
VFGNFGVAILVVTVLVKLIFFPLANKSYASMAKMKAVQPQINALKERFPDDKMKLQQEMMEIYKKEKINPISGCLPVLLQIPVFFSLYKVLFVTIEMRHAPFFSWIKDLSAPDPTHIFNLFGLLPYDPSVVPLFGPYLAIGAWPIIMGITMWFQMKLNPTPPDPTQKIIFDWMPVIFTFMLASFPAGLVIYWAWNNTLSVIQQSYIMRRNGVKVELFDNVKSTFRRKSSDKPAKTT